MCFVTILSFTSSSVEQYVDWIVVSSIPPYMSLPAASGVSVSANKAFMPISGHKPLETRIVLHAYYVVLLLIRSGILAILID